MSTRAALRRLSSVEIDLGASNQREFHAGALAHFFGFEGRRNSGALLAVYCPVTGEMVFEESHYTLYDARTPPRTEFHLYPATHLFVDHGNAGDLLVIMRAGTREELCIIVAQRGSAMESSLLASFLSGVAPVEARFQFPSEERHLDLDKDAVRTLVELADRLGFALT